MISEGIEKLGFGQWFQDHVGPVDLSRFDIARVKAVHKDSYIINKGENDVYAELIGKMVFNAASALDYPAVGDWVLATFHDGDSFSIIHDVLPRKSLLKRKTAGKRVDFQLIAANVDVAFIVQSLDANFNLRRLERYLVMVEEGNIRPVVLLSKSDLLETGAVAERVAEVENTMPFLQVQPFSNEDGSGLNRVKDFLSPGQTYCLLGSSGVGKTTLLNHLVGGASRYATKTVGSKDGKGRHATTHRQLIMLDCRAMLIDTPGMRELGHFSVDAGIDETFAEITALSEQCRFADCRHADEAGCAVLQAVRKGQIPEKRYQNYIKMKKESLYNEMSYLEKRRKDKQFGKFCKVVMQGKKHRR